MVHKGIFLLSISETTKLKITGLTYSSTITLGAISMQKITNISDYLVIPCQKNNYLSVSEFFALSYNF